MPNPIKLENEVCRTRAPEASDHYISFNEQVVGFTYHPLPIRSPIVDCKYSHGSRDFPSLPNIHGGLGLLKYPDFTVLTSTVIHCLGISLV